MGQGIDWAGILVNWLPMLLILAVWILFIYRLNWRNGYGTQYQRDHMEQMKRQTEALERIAAQLESKNRE